MKNNAVARRYARALFEMAQESRSVRDVIQAIGNLRSALENDPALTRALYNPLLNTAAKQKLFSVVTSNKLVLRFLALLDTRKRLDLLTAVHEHLVHLDDESIGLKRALVRTAAPLSEAQRRAVEERLASLLGGTVLGRFDVSPDLIGGVWVQIGDNVWDATLKGRVEDWRHHLVYSNN